MRVEEGVVYGTEDIVVSFTYYALSIVDGATSAGGLYEFHPLENHGHSWLRDRLRENADEGMRIDDLMYQFLNRVLYNE